MYFTNTLWPFRKVFRNKPMSILSASYFHDEAAAYEMLENLLWRNGSVCARRQGQARITPVKGGRIGLYRCGPCKR